MPGKASTSGSVSDTSNQHSILPLGNVINAQVYIDILCAVIIPIYAIVIRGRPRQPDGWWVRGWYPIAGRTLANREAGRGVAMLARSCGQPATAGQLKGKQGGFGGYGKLLSGSERHSRRSTWDRSLYSRWISV